MPTAPISLNNLSPYKSEEDYLEDLRAELIKINPNITMEEVKQCGDNITLMLKKFI